MEKKMQKVTYVNQVGRHASGRWVLFTWNKGNEHAGHWTCELFKIIDGSARNEDWEGMDKNLVECHRLLTNKENKNKSFEELQSLGEFEVEVEIEVVKPVFK